MANWNQSEDLVNCGVLPVSQYRASLATCGGGFSQVESNELTQPKIEPSETVHREEFNDVAVVESDLRSPEEVFKICKTLMFPSPLSKTNIRSMIQPNKSNKLAHYHKIILFRILKELLSLHRWKDAAGVLSVLLQGTVKDHFFCRHQFKYYAAMEVLRQLEHGDENTERYNRLYSLLKAKQPAHKTALNKNLQAAATLEKALYLANKGDLIGALHTSKLVIQVRLSNISTVSNFVHGMILYQLWYKGTVEDLHVTSNDVCVVSKETKMELINLNKEDSRAHNSLSDAHMSSIRTIKEENKSSESESSMDNEKGHTKCQGYHKRKYDYFKYSTPQNMEVDILNTEEIPDEHFPDGGTIDLEQMNVLFSQDMDRYLFPIQLPTFQEGMKYEIPTEKGNLISFHLGALKHLELASSTSPDSIAALLPYLQLLLTYGEVRKAWMTVQKFCQDTEHFLPASLRARLAKSLSLKRSDLILKCYVEVMRRNPASISAVKHLVMLHKTGHYPLEPLVENIALHLDATQGTLFAWKALAVLFLSIQKSWQFENEMDRLSSDNNQNCSTNFKLSNAHGLPDMFVKATAKNTWKLRCRWWRRKHFGREILQTEVQMGAWKLLTYKASCAAHIMGPAFGYVETAASTLESASNKKLDKLNSHCNSSLRISEHVC